MIKTERQQLRELYLDDLRRLVNNRGKSPRPRVRFVEAVWSKIESPEENLLNIQDYPNVWVWSDTHFGHNNIIKYCDRPYESVIEMDEMLIQNHNDTVGPGDLVIWVGDVAFKGDDAANEILRQLHGDRILIVGNHDIKKKRLKKLEFDEIYPLYTIDDPICPLVFTHYTMENAPLPWINIHGHVHNSPHDCDKSLQHINVSVEVLDYKPINLEVLWRMARSRLESIE